MLLAVHFSLVVMVAGAACCPFQCGECETETTMAHAAHEDHHEDRDDSPDTGFCAGPDCLCHQQLTCQATAVVCHEQVAARHAVAGIDSGNQGVVNDILHIPIA